MIIDFITQIINDIQQNFNSRNDEYKNISVKEIYKDYKANFPRITIEEINNQESITRRTSEGEMTTNLAYQIVLYSRDMNQYDAIDSVKFMATIIDNIMSNKYKMRRLGSPSLKPYISDKTIMTYTLRYNCVYDKENNLIYTY